MYECFHCLAKSVVWQADYDFEDLGYEGNGIVHVLECTNCGASIEYKIDLDEDTKNLQSKQQS